MNKEYYAIVRRSTNELAHYGVVGMRKGVRKDRYHPNESKIDELAEKLRNGSSDSDRTSDSGGTVYKEREKPKFESAYKHVMRIMKENEERRKRRQTKEGQENRRVNDRELRRNAIITDTNRKHRRNTNIYQRLNGR